MSNTKNRKLLPAVNFSVIRLQDVIPVKT